MQPETAFWLLSATAQSSAALAGLSAVLWVFFMKGFGDEWRREYSFDDEDEESGKRQWVLKRFVWFSSYYTAFFILALVVALLTLGFVNPGPDPIPIFQVYFVWLSVSLTLFAGVMMTVFVVSAHRMLFREDTH